MVINAKGKAIFPDQSQETFAALFSVRRKTPRGKKSSGRDTQTRDGDKKVYR